MADVTTPVPDATAVGLLLAGRLLGFNLLMDQAGADAMGLVTASPAANSLLGRLKAAVDALGVNNTATALTTAADDGFAITPGASILTTIPKALLVTATGTLSVGGTSNSAINFGTVQAGTIIPFRARYVYSAGTSATVVGLV